MMTVWKAVKSSKGQYQQLHHLENRNVTGYNQDEGKANFFVKHLAKVQTLLTYRKIDGDDVIKDMMSSYQFLFLRQSLPQTE